jgi:hypothetical protein
MASGTIRQFHLVVLVAVSRGNVTRGDDFEYHIVGRGRHVSEAVYLLEGNSYVELHRDGTVTPTDAGRQYLAKRTSQFSDTVNA